MVCCFVGGHQAGELFSLFPTWWLWVGVCALLLGACFFLTLTTSLLLAPHRLIEPSMLTTAKEDRLAATSRPPLFRGGQSLQATRPNSSVFGANEPQTTPAPTDR